MMMQSSSAVATQVTESSQQGRQLQGRILNSHQNVSSPSRQIGYTRYTAIGAGRGGAEAHAAE